MIPTPDLSHLTKQDYDEIYEPAEDSFLLLDALEQDAASLQGLAPSICLEVGSGSGCVSSFIGNILGPSVLYLSTDINPHACRCTRATGKKNCVDIDAVNTSLVDPFSKRLEHKVDVLLFNPPYVPTSEEEAVGAQRAHDVGAAWAGGGDGMRVTDILLNAVERLLSPTGRFYLVAVRQNNIPQILESMKELHDLDGTIAMQRKAGREHLFILRFTLGSRRLNSNVKDEIAT